MNKFKSSCRRLGFTAVALVWAIAGPIAMADTVSPTILQDFPFLKFYLRHVFAGIQNEQLMKFENIDDIPISFKCANLEQQACDQAGQLAIQGFQPTSNLKFHHSFTPQIRVFFGSLATVKSLEKETMVALNPTELTDISDESCEVIVAVEESKIIHAEIFISIDQSDIRQKTCAVSQVSRALGLNGSPIFSFLNRWNEVKDLFENPTSDEYEKYRRNNIALQYIHYCTLLRAGSTEQQVADLLTANEECFKNINLHE